MKNPNPHRFHGHADRVSPSVRSIQGDNSGLTYRQENAIRAMARRRAEKTYGSRILMPQETQSLHAEVAAAATKEFGFGVSSQQVKLAVKSMRRLEAGATKSTYPVDAGSDCYAFIAYVADAEGRTLKDTLGMMVAAFRQGWRAPA